MISIAIDGPAGAGKSTVAKALAKKLKFQYIDTGALYRAMGLYMLENNIDINSEEAVQEKIKKIRKIKLGFNKDGQFVTFDGALVSNDIRSKEVSMAASKISAYKTVRDCLLNLQREVANDNNIIMDGRDIGTVILPNANLKIFLTASPEERARRRFAQVINKKSTTYSEVLDEINTRDYNDSHRNIAPLKPADNAIILDSTDLSFEEVILEILNHARHIIKEVYD
jgi:cytidylate kinase